MERKLAAILAADVVGYSALMEADEAGTFTRLRAGRKELFDPEINKHHGRIFKLMGDGLLAEFGSVVDAVECAVTLQRGMAERNAIVPQNERIEVRIGINLGEVIVDGEDRYGDGVNIAARLQQLAEPGGICVSGKVSKEVEKKLTFAFKPMGEHRVKNIAEPIAVYRVLSEGTAPANAAARRIGKRSLRRIVAALAIILLTVLASGFVWYSYRGDAVEQGQGIPVIAVIPFQDLTGDQAGKELGKGVAEAFMTDLATFPDYEVVSAATSFSLADKSISDIVKTTGATFIVEGSVRRTADKLKVTMQLIRGSTDRHLMIAEIEEPMTDPVSLQAAVASRLSDALGGMTGVLRRESNRIALAKNPTQLTEYDYYILGHIKHFRQQGSAARDIWAKGLKRFPGSVLLRCKMALYFLAFTSDMDSVEKLVSEARELKRKSRLDEWYLHWTSAWVEMNQRGDDQRAIAEAEATIAMAPYDTVSRMDLSYLMQRAGRQDQAIAWATYAATHDPAPLSWYRETLVSVYRLAGKSKDLIDLAERETQSHPPKKFWYEVLYAAYRATGQTDKAQKAIETAGDIPDPPED